MVKTEIWFSKLKDMSGNELYYLAGLLAAEMRGRKLNYNIELVPRK